VLIAPSSRRTLSLDKNYCYTVYIVMYCTWVCNVIYNYLKTIWFNVKLTMVKVFV
jgi:hypothetical protein